MSDLFADKGETSFVHLMLFRVIVTVSAMSKVPTVLASRFVQKTPTMTTTTKSQRRQNVQTFDMIPPKFEQIC